MGPSLTRPSQPVGLPTKVNNLLDHLTAVVARGYILPTLARERAQARPHHPSSPRSALFRGNRDAVTRCQLDSSCGHPPLGPVCSPNARPTSPSIVVGPIHHVVTNQLKSHYRALVTNFIARKDHQNFSTASLGRNCLPIAQKDHQNFSENTPRTYAWFVPSFTHTHTHSLGRGEQGQRIRRH